MPSTNLSSLIKDFLGTYDSLANDQVWQLQSQCFRNFWDGRILSNDNEVIPDSECDEIIKILDRNGKGNTKDAEAVAKAMVPQGAWRRMFNEFHTNKNLAGLLTNIFQEKDLERKAALIDQLYNDNKGQKNNLTGPSGNTIGAFLAAYDPVNNLSMISLNDRRRVIEFLELQVPFDWDTASIGTRIVSTNKIIIDEFHSLGLDKSARTITRFCYSPDMKAIWKGEHTVQLTDKSINVTIPTVEDDLDGEVEQLEEVRESMQIQALLAKIGTYMGFTIWLPKADRSRVLKAWTPAQGELIDTLPLGYDSGTIKTIEQIDVIWLKNRSIVRAFEVEHTTSVYSGLLRMADLVALQPNINIHLHIVAPVTKRDKVIQEIQRPVFSLLEGRALKEMCTYLSYDSVKDIGDLKHLTYLSDKVIEDYEEVAE